MYAGKLVFMFRAQNKYGGWSVCFKSRFANVRHGSLIAIFFKRVMPTGKFLNEPLVTIWAAMNVYL